MAQTKSKFFSVMIVGENPESILEDYRIDKKVEPYIKYRFLEAEKYRNVAIKVSEGLINDANITMISPSIKLALQENLKSLKLMSTFEYYRKLTEGMYYDNDGNALSDKNPNGKWKTAHIGRNFSLPLILKDGSNTYSVNRSDQVDWSKMHLTNQGIYEAAWEMVMEDRKPANEEEKKIYESMKDKQAYFSNFSTKENYVNYSTAYWNYAYVDENGWDDMSSHNEQEWINSFYDKFIMKLNGDESISIYECTVNDDE